MTLWERAALGNPGHPYVLNALGLAYMDVGRDAEALEALLSALEANEADAEVHLNLASLGFKKGNYAAAERHTFRALEISPRSPRAYRYLGGLLHQSQDVAVARRSADRVTALGLFDAGTLEMLGGRRGQRPAPSEAED